MKVVCALRLAIGFGVLLTFSTATSAQIWTRLNNTPPTNVNDPLLLTDGTVIVQGVLSCGLGTGKWYRLTPDSTGSYISGTWTQIASMPSGYGPDFFGSAVLPDGRVIAEGGEYNLESCNNGSIVETNLGAIYNPATNTWTSVNPPANVTKIGDASSSVLANGTFMLGNCCNSTQYLLNASNLTWTSTGTGKADPNSEEGWTLLPSGKVLTVDVSNGMQSELYNTSTGSWSLAGSTGVSLVTCSEIGPAVLRPDGTVLAAGATSNTAIYSANSAKWSTGPSFLSGYGIADGPGALLPDGNVLVQAAPISTCYTTGSKFFEFNGTTLTQVPAPPNAPNDPSFVGRMLVLPTGQIFFVDNSTDVEIYTPSGTFNSAWQPTISSFPANIAVGSTGNAISGTQFNGLSQGAMYGDNAQMATNYPLVRVTNNLTGHVFYCKTHDHSTMAVATGAATVSTEFDLPSNVETGPSTLQVVANGIPSNQVDITVTVPSFITRGSMNTARYGHASALLQNGMVLVLGGTNGSVFYSSAELYNPPLARFATTGSMTVARYKPTATLLNDGMVLVTGGITAPGTTAASAELYNPSTGKFTATGSMHYARVWHTASLLSSGMVLITGGHNGSSDVAAAELYNPSTGTFTVTGSLLTPRTEHTATLLGNGTVLIAGGINNGGILSSAELYDPSTGVFTATGSLHTARYVHTATTLGSGMVLIAGGSTSSSSGTSSAELYNSATGTFAVTGSMNAGRSLQTAILLNNGLALVAGGYNGSFLSSAELYNPLTGAFSATASLNTARDLHIATLLNDGSVLVAGGANGGVLASSELYVY
ncbi:MAG TPA: kelch repeat-containing protein [Candidatus Acidoferrales bacterium]|nr:kelch repeat-containing protein [Candidatus Acidoferrales bacterium]